MVQRRYKQLQINSPVIINDVVVNDKPLLSYLTNNNDILLPTTTASLFQTPKRKQIRLTARAKHNTALDINSEKLNCAEDRRVCWTTEGYLKLWFDT